MGLKVKILIAAATAAVLLGVTTGCTKSADGTGPTTAQTPAVTSSASSISATGSSATPTTSDDTSPSTAAVSSQSNAPSSTASPSTKPEGHTSTATTATTTWKPPDYGTAQPAVAAYLALIDAYDRGLKDPTDPPTKLIYRYAAGQAYDLLIASIADEKTHGTAWRGKPQTSRVVVESNKASASPLPQVTLSDCPIPSSDWEQYVVKTGASVPKEKQSPPPPYTITAVLMRIEGDWVVAQLKVDGSKTCAR